jgi:hypothetical protein
MMTRIREQLERSPELKPSEVFSVSSSAIQLPAVEGDVQLERLVLQVAQHVTDTVMLALRKPQNSNQISNSKPANGRTEKRRMHGKAKNSDRRR